MALRLSPADELALQRLLAVRPALTAIARADRALGLQGRTLLHAGPPTDGASVVEPILNSAIAATLFEGWAGTAEEARALVRSGTVALRPAQDFRAVVPLAAVLSPIMLVQVVADQADRTRVAYSAFNGGSGPCLRLGIFGPNSVEHLRWLNTEFGPRFASALSEPIALVEIADRALQQGDDCHGRTIAGTRALLERIRPQLRVTPSGSDAIGFLESSPGFFLNVWMAASKCILSAAEGPESSIVTAVGGNGATVGLQLGAQPGQWITAPAAPPTGTLESGVSDKDRLGAIGDSAVVDALGFGAMAMAHAPEQTKTLGPFMPEPSEALGAKLLAQRHPSFQTAIRVGLSARRVIAVGASLAISLGILDRSGRRGRIGGGIYVPPVSLFEQALARQDRAVAGPQGDQTDRQRRQS